MPFIPLHDQNPRVLIGRPWVTWGLILGSSLVYLYEALAGPDELQRLVLGLGAIPAVVAGELRIPDEFYLVPPLFTLITYQFLHGEPLHLIFNMAYLWVFGDNIEDAMGHRRFRRPRAPGGRPQFEVSDHRCQRRHLGNTGRLSRAAPQGPRPGAGPPLHSVLPARLPPALGLDRLSGLRRRPDARRRR
jgi:hypothetical protein